MIDRLPSKHVVLLGIGHTNAHVLRMWGMQPIPDASLTCISDHTVATYSGMLPAVLAGQVPKQQMEIDLVRLCSSVGARLITGQVTAIDHDRRELQFDDRPPVYFDALSIGIGSVPTTDGLIEGDKHVVPIKPMQTFLQRLKVAIKSAQPAGSSSPLKLMVVGGGVAGIEITFCLSPFASEVTGADHSIHLITRSDEILPDVLTSTRRKVVDQLRRRDVEITTGKMVSHVRPGQVTLSDGTAMDADVVIWATGAVAPDSLGKWQLPLNDRGFIATESTLRSVSGRPVFAVGDTGTIVGHALPKAGVYAVRQGPILWENLHRLFDGQPLKEYSPQQSFLKLINRGDGSAIGQWKGFSFSGRWVMRLKDRIDSKFMEKFRPVTMADDGDDSMQCRGCGCKLGGDLLESALAGSSGPDIKLEDAAEIGGDSDCPLIASTDFFSSPLDDAYLAGRVAALHAASDIVATGATPISALANVVLPEGDSATQQRMLGDFLAGARLEFDAMGADVVGGHTIVGPRMETGFTVIGRPLGRSLIRKENLKPGDQLYLTKPLGIGLLLAGHMRSLCSASDYQQLIEAMLARQHQLAAIAVDCDIDAGTDVTGFGLAGHLLEMLEASDVATVIQLETIPLLAGVSEIIRQGVESSLAPANRRAEKKISADAATRQRPAYAALFDPQTCGGLLLAISDDRSPRLLDAISQTGIPTPICIGQVERPASGEKRLKVV